MNKNGFFFEKVDSPDHDNCVFTALSIALDKSEDDVRRDLEKYGDNPKSEVQWGKYLIDNGFHKVNIEPMPNRTRIFVETLARIALPNQILVCRGSGHIITIKNRKFYDRSNATNSFCVFWYYTK